MKGTEGSEYGRKCSDLIRVTVEERDSRRSLRDWGLLRERGISVYLMENKECGLRNGRRD